MKPGGVTHQIIGSFEDIGKSIAEEATKVPGQVVDTAIESLGMSGGKKQQAQQQKSLMVGEGKPRDPNSPLEKIGKVSEKSIKKLIARSALEELSGAKQRKEEPSVYDQKIQEEAAKKEKEKETIAVSQAQALQPTGAKRQKGDLYGVSAKRAKAERKLVGVD